MNTSAVKNSFEIHKMETPLVSVILPVYNDSQFLKEAVDSILNQTLKSFELIIVDDGSDEATKNVLANFKTEQRIKIITKPTNNGIVAALKDGLNAAQGKYIARMDSDDISSPDRLERQVKALEAHPDISVLGGAVEMFLHGDDTKKKLVEHPTSVGTVHWSMFFNCCIVHPSIICRKEVLQDLSYSSAYMHNEDYDLWLRIITQSNKYKISNLPKPHVLRLRKHDNNLSKKFRSVQHEGTLNLLHHYWQTFAGADIDKSTVEALYNVKLLDSADKFDRACDAIEKLEKKFLSLGHLSTEEKSEISAEATKRMGELASLSLKYFPNPSESTIWRKWLSRNPSQQLSLLMGMTSLASNKAAVNSEQKPKSKLNTSRLSVICFSKDRAFQLKEYLRTLLQYALKNIELTVYVLYLTTPPYTKSYEKLAEMFPQVKFVREHNFAAQLKELLNKSDDYILWGVDDVYYYNPVDFKAHVEYMNEHPDILCSHFRLSPNVTYCHPADSHSKVPSGSPVAESSDGNTILKYDRTEGTNDWNYPFELCATLMRKTEAIETIELIEKSMGVECISHPNKLEVSGARLFTNNIHPLSHLNYCLCVKKPVLSVITVNRVQSVCENRIYDEIDLDTLDKYFWNEDSLDDGYYRGKVFDAVHIGDFELVKKQ